MNRPALHLLACTLLFACTAACAADAPAADSLPITKSEMAKDYAQQTRALTPEETQELARLNAYSLQIIRIYYLPTVEENDITPEILDRAYAAWLKDLRSKRDPETKAAAFGVRLGMLALKSCPGAWLHVHDNYGDTVAIEFRDSKKQVYPIDSVWKRYKREESGFFADLYNAYLLACHDKLK